MKPITRLLLRIWWRVRRLFPGLPLPYLAPWGVWLLLQYDDTAISLLRGTYDEAELIRFVMSILRPGDVFFDIGANQGMYTLAAAKVVTDRGKAFAIEPNPAEIRKLRANLRMNRLRNVSILECAIGLGRPRQGVFVCEPRKSGFSSLREPDRKDIAWEKLKVDVVGLDEIVERAKVKRVDYIKMDVEGGERDIIASGQMTFTRQPRPIVQFEVNDKRTGCWNYRAAVLPEWFERAGYSVYELNENGVQRHQIQDYYPVTNLVAVPDEQMSRFLKVARLCTPGDPS